MAIYHLNAKVITKSKGHSACQFASYVSGEKIKSEALGQTFNHTKPEVVYSNILLPKNAPQEYTERSKLWNSVERKEKAINAQLARSLIIALPEELTLEEQIELVNNYCQKNFVDKGMCADINLHNKNDGNPHAHVLLTMRGIDEHGQWMAKQKNTFKLDEEGNRIPIMDKKTSKQKVDKNNRKQWAKENTSANNWSAKETLVEWRAEWAAEQNKCLNAESQVDHRTLQAQGIDREPTRHVGYRGGTKNADKLVQNKEIGLVNETKQDIREINKQIEDTETEQINNFVRVRTLKQALTDGEEKDNGRHGGDKQNNSGSGTTNIVEELRKRTIAAVSQGTDRADRAADTTDNKFAFGEILASADAAILARKNRDFEQQRQDIAAKDAADRQLQKRIRQAEYRAPEPKKQSEKDDLER